MTRCDIVIIYKIGNRAVVVNDLKNGEKTHGERVLQLMDPQGMLGGILLDNTHPNHHPMDNILWS